jgi:glycosyltransferase involved in cell wall biosynthesis
LVDEPYLFSIITPSFNKGSFIEETIVSIQSQNYRFIEHIIIDGCSTDNTVEVLKRYGTNGRSISKANCPITDGDCISPVNCTSNKTWWEDRSQREQYLPPISWISESDNGQADAINKGLRMAKGAILAFLNADDLYLPNTIERVAEYFAEHPEVDLVYGDIIHIDESGGNDYPIQSGPLDIDGYLGCMFYLPQPTVFFKRCVYEALGDFDVSLHLALDLDYWLRLYFKFKWGYIPQPLAKARIYGEAKSKALNYRYLDERLYIIDKIAHHLTPEQKKWAITRIHYYGGLEYLRIGKPCDAFHHMGIAMGRDPRVIITPGMYFAFFNSFFGRKTGDAVRRLIDHLF